MKEKLYNSNSYYEGLIQNLYAGSKGSFSLFMHFFYQYNQACVYFSDYEESFKQIYLIELENSEILSKILIKMGGDNKFYSSSRKYLSGNNVDYLKNLQRIFLLDIELLEIGVLEVKSIINKIENLEIKNDLKIVLNNKKKALKILKENYFKNNIIE